MSFEERIKKWCELNDYRYKGSKGNAVLLERLSDDYPFEVDKRLLEMIMTDEGF